MSNTTTKIEDHICKRLALIAPFGHFTQELATQVASRNKAKVTDLSFKTLDSAMRKCQSRKCDVSELRDLARTTIVCDFNAISKVVKDLVDTLKHNGCFGRYVQQEYETRGYWGVIVNPVFLVNGQMVMTEIQITSYEMFYASHSTEFCTSCLGENLYKSIRNAVGIEGGKGHLLYEISRDESGLYTNEQKKKAEKENYNYYNNFRGNYKFGETKFLN